MILERLAPINMQPLRLIALTDPSPRWGGVVYMVQQLAQLAMGA